MNGEAWTKERDTQLRKLRDAGLTFSQIAAALAVTRSAVISEGGPAWVGEARATCNAFEIPETSDHCDASSGDHAGCEYARYAV